MTSRPPAPQKPTYRTLVVEQHVDAPRSRVWDVLERLLGEGTIGPVAAGLGTERVLSHEPPWRRVARVELPPLPLVEHTIAIRDDGDECHLVWAYVAEPPQDPADSAATDAQLARLEGALRDGVERVVAAAERG